MDPIKYKAIEKAVYYDLSLHPKASLKDLYKNFFQDSYGAGHLIENEDKALNYLKKEIRYSTKFENHNYHILGYKHQFVRLNLKLLKDGTVPLAVFFPLFLESVSSMKIPPIESWKQEWKAIESVILKMDLQLENVHDDIGTIALMHKKGEYVGHHSSAYEKLYHPHYRIIDRERFEIIKKKYLKSSTLLPSD